ncbi:MAG: hypothetical protein IKO93_10115 [Lentisphaeria bacterium]|nr:hypothetical protein [Lentisphaeria bacterium]
MPFPDFSDIEQRIQHNYPNVDLTYNWKWPPTNQKILDFYGDPIDGLTEEEFTVRLFQKFHDAFQKAAGNKDRIIEIINLIVAEWGGIRNNKPAKIETYANYLISNKLKKLAVTTGIASKSKILAAWDPNQYYIYDSRVAIALQTLYFGKYKFSIPNPKTSENRKAEIKEITGELKQSAGSRVRYCEFCEGLKNKGNGNQLEKKLFMLGGYIEENGLK